MCRLPKAGRYSCKELYTRYRRTSFLGPLVFFFFLESLTFCVKFDFDILGLLQHIGVRIFQIGKGRCARYAGYVSFLGLY